LFSALLNFHSSDQQVQAKRHIRTHPQTVSHEGHVSTPLSEMLLAWYMHVTHEWSCSKCNHTNLMKVCTFHYIQLTSHNTVLEKITNPQLDTKSPTFHGTQKLITMFTKTCHWSLSWIIWIHTHTLFLHIWIEFCVWLGKSGLVEPH